MESTIKIMSYNILSNKWAVYDENNLTTCKIKDRYSYIPEVNKERILGWEHRLPKIIDRIAKINPDIICLQEIDLEDINENFINNLAEYDCTNHIIWKPGMDKKIYKRTNDIGNAIFWKRNIFTKNNDSLNSCGVFAELCHIKSNFKFLMINVHLKAGTDSGIETRMSQIESCCRKITKIPVVICGDFNEELDTNSPVRELLIKKNFTFCQSQITCDVYWHPEFKHYFHAFDHVISQNLDICVETLAEPTEGFPNEDEPSDHYPLVFEIKIEI